MRNLLAMENLSAGEMVGLFGLFWLCAFIYIGYRFLRNTKEARLKGAALRAVIDQRAAARGRRMENGRGEVEWTMHGALPGGVPWTLAYVVSLRERLEMPSDSIDRRRSSGITIEIAPSMQSAPQSRMERNTISGQRLEWRCPELRHDSFAFSFHKRSDDEPKTGEVIFGEGEKLWWRWRLVAGNEALARKAFGPATCALLEKLPLRAAINTLEDERTSITFGTDGLVFVRGVYDFDADQVDLIIAVAEALAEELRNKTPAIRH